jgi:hypothetical protein
MGGSEVSTSVVNWNEGLRARVSIIIRRFIDHMRFAAYVAVWLITFFHSIMVLFYVIVNIVIYILFWVFSFIVLICVLFVCKCVLYCCTVCV